MVESFTTIADGTSIVTLEGRDLGRVSNVVYRNTDQAKRECQALVFQSRYRLATNWSVTGHDTIQLRDHGNYEGEGSNTPGSTGFIGDYPEAASEARYHPDGRLPNFRPGEQGAWGPTLLGSTVTHL